MSLYRPHTISLLVVFTLLYFGCAIIIVAMHYSSSPKVADLGKAALELSLMTVELGCRAVEAGAETGFLTNHSTSSAISSMTTAVNQSFERLQRFQLASMNEAVRSIEERLNATVNVMSGLILAWETKFLTTCNMDAGDPPHSKTAGCMALFLESARSYEGFFRYIWFDELDVSNNSKWVENGWGSVASDPLYVMGNDQIWYYYHEDPLLRNESFLRQEPLPYPVETEDQITFILGGESGWRIEVYYDISANSLFLLSNYLIPVFRSQGLAGIFGISLETNFLTEALRHGMPAPTSTVFVVDVQTNRVIADTNADVALFPTLSPDTNFDDWVPPLPYLITDISDSLLHAAAQALERKFGSLSNVSNGDLLMTFGGVEYVIVFHVFRRENLHWLACQLTDRAYFSFELVEAAHQTLHATEDARTTVSESSTELMGLHHTGLTASEAVDKIMKAISKVFQSMFHSIAICGATFLIVAMVMVLVVMFIVRPVNVLADEMDAVAQLDLEDKPVRTSSVIEIDKLWTSFGVVVHQLAVYKQFLPQVLVSPALLESEESKAQALASQAQKQCSRPASPLRSPHFSRLRILPNKMMEHVPSVASLDSPRHFSIAGSNSVEERIGAGSPTNPLEASARTTTTAPQSVSISRRRQSHVTRHSHSSRRSTCASLELLQMVQYGTILCVNLSGTHRMLECFTSNMTLRNIVTFVEAMLKHKKDALPLSFFGDRVLFAFTRTSHVTTAINAAVEMARGASQGSLQVTVGISSGKIVMGAMGFTGLKAFNCVGPVVGKAVSLMDFCSTVRTKILVDEEVYLKARYSYQFLPVAIVQFPKCPDGPHPIYHPTRPLTLDDSGEWMLLAFS